MKQRSDDGRDVIIEFHQVGDYVKVSAMDTAILTEISIVGDPSVGEAELTRIALRKLKYVLEKNDKPAGGRR
jgi:hypothetical protein